MQMYLALALALLQIASASAAAVLPSRSPLSARLSQDCVEAEKYIGINPSGFYSSGCARVVDQCISTINSTASTDLWSEKSCVAAATCQEASSVVFVVGCTNPGITLPAAANLPHLNYNIYAGIVGECAWQAGGCPITQQNYIDFIYGAFSDADVTVWPVSSAEVVINFWDPILAWTATGTTIPYTNFDDWLHYA